MWYKISEVKPPLNEVIMTKIFDENGERCEQRLIYDGKFWWLPDKSMYVYYEPTHWEE